MKRSLEHREGPSAKRPARHPKVVREKVKLESRRLIIVFDQDAKSEVLAKQCLRSVNDEHAKFPLVRRNKKIQKVMEMSNRETKTQIKAHAVTSKRGDLSEVDCIYGQNMVEVFQHPDYFDFHSVRKFLPLDVWNVTRPHSKSIIAETDFSKEESQEIIPELECDVGVLKRSVQQILAKKTHDVIAINTHPGHHAGPKRLNNYCALNNNAILAAMMKNKKANIKLGVIDIDVHPGDGTHQFIKRYRHLVNRYVSIHCSSKFLNMNSDLGFNGAALKLNKKGKVAPERFTVKIKEVLESWNQARLDIIIVSLGFDTLKADTIAGPEVGFHMLPVHFHEVGDTFGQRPEQILFVQEGGYHVNETAAAFDNLINGFREGRKSYEHMQRQPALQRLSASNAGLR